MDEERWLTYREIGHLLGVGDRAALNWVKEHDLPIAPGRPARVAYSAVVAKAEQLRRPLAPLPNYSEVGNGPLRNNSEASGSGSGDFGSDSEPIEATFTSIDEGSAIALVPLTTVADQLQAFADRLAELAQRNEGLALEVGQLRERTAGQVERLAEHQETIAELRRRAEVAERERDALRRLAVPQPPSEAPSNPAPVDTPGAEKPAGGFWWRVRRWLDRLEGY